MRAVGGQHGEVREIALKQPRAHRSWTPLGRALTATGDHWTLLIVLQLAVGRMRLSQLQQCLPGISTGVLERYVQQMVALDLLTRTRYREMPPRVELELTDSGLELLPIAIALARWGMLHMWSAPAERERVGIELMLRVLPVLLERKLDVPEATVQAALFESDEVLACVGYRIRDGVLELDAAAIANADSRVAGDTNAWIAALGPSADYTQLLFAGEQRPARAILDALPRSASRVKLLS